MTASAPTIGPTRGPLLSRVFAALTLRRDFYEAAAVDVSATGPAGAIVCLVAMLRESVVLYELSQVLRVWGLMLPVLAFLALGAWLLISAVAWLVTRPFVPSPPPFRRLLRCLGFAQTPTMMLATLAAVTDPTLYLIAYAALMTWVFAGIVVALRAAADTSTGRAVALALPVFVVQFVLLVLSRWVALG